MSELKQEKKQLTFEEICPKWSRMIANFENLSDELKQKIMRDLKRSSTCFLAEAWKFGIKECDECRESYMGFIGNGLCGPFMDHVVFHHPFNWQDFNDRKEVFVKHWNEVHIK